MTTQGAAFDARFPGLVGHTLTGLAATIMFKIPVIHELFIHMGYVDASHSIANKAMASGRLLFICTGGEEESMLTTRGKDCCLEETKGIHLSGSCSWG